MVSRVPLAVTPHWTLIMQIAARSSAIGHPAAYYAKMSGRVPFTVGGGAVTTSHLAYQSGTAPNFTKLP